MADTRPFGHESSAVKTGMVLKVIAGIFGMLLVAAVVVYFVVLHGVMADHAQVVERPETTPPKPHLQPDPDADLARFREQKKAALSGYAWDGPGHRFARIPIRRAMQLYVRQQQAAALEKRTGDAAPPGDAGGEDQP